MTRSEAVDKLTHRYRRREVARSALGSRVVCDDKILLFEEHPEAYKAIEPVIAALEAHHQATRVADLTLLVPAGLTQIDDDLLRALKLRLRRAPGSPTTIRWHTFGMPAALADDEARWPRHRQWGNGRRHTLWNREHMSKRAGFLCYTAPPEVLRVHALGIYGMRAWGDGYYPLAEHGARARWHYDGEFQVIPGFADAVSAARVARRELLDDEADPIATDDDRWTIYRGKTAALERLHAARRRTPRRVSTR